MVSHGLDHLRFLFSLMHWIALFDLGFGVVDDYPWALSSFCLIRFYSLAISARSGLFVESEPGPLDAVSSDRTLILFIEASDSFDLK